MRDQESVASGTVIGRVRSDICIIAGFSVVFDPFAKGRHQKCMVYWFYSSFNIPHRLNTRPALEQS